MVDRRTAARTRERRRRVALSAGGGVVAAGAAAAAVMLSLGGGSGTTAAAATLPHPPAATGNALPPWPAPADPSAGIREAGLLTSPMEGSAVHFHSHLDIDVDGRPVPVAAQIGINVAAGFLSELHTHDTTGVLHVESPVTDKRYVLGQLFDEWNVRLDATHLGGLTAGQGMTLSAYVDGKRFTGNPAEIELLPHREIALVYGSASQHATVPSSYAFPAGE